MPLSLTITDNSASMLYIKPAGRSVTVRLHRMFLSADDDVLDEIADYIKKNRKKTPLIREFINGNTHMIKKRSPRKIALKPVGRIYNLLDIYNSLNDEYFGGRVSAEITWGSKGPRRAARRRTLGSYSGRDNMIRINPLLDSRRVPLYFVTFILYHEMLHADMGTSVAAGRRTDHSKKFRERERLFKDYERAIRWERRRWGE